MKTISPHGALVSARVLRLFGCLSLTAALTAAPLEASTWSGAGSATDWSDTDNWDVAPTGTDVIFDATGVTSGTTPTNVVDTSLSILSLTYQYHDATQRHITEIANGQTLTITGGTGTNALLVGGLASNTVTYHTQAVIQGDGTLNITASGKDVVIANHRQSDVYATNPATATLDMSGLAVLNVDLGTTGSFNIGSNRVDLATAHQATKGVVYLAQDSTITAGALRVGAVTGSNSHSLSNVFPSELHLGAKTVLNVDTIAVGVGFASRAAGTMAFASSILDESPEIKIRAADGVSAVSSFRIGATTSGTSTSQIGHVDFTGGEVDLLVTDLIIGSGRGSGSSAGAASTGSFTMDRGQVVATDVIVGQTYNGAATVSTNDGRLHINGGSFAAATLMLAERTGNTQKVYGEVNIRGGAEVSIENGIVLGKGTTGGETDTVTAVLNVEDGTLTSGGNIGRGDTSAFIHATLNLKGGTVDLTGHDINVDTLTLESGRLIDVGEITSGNGVVKTTAGTLALEGTNSYTAATVVEEGTLRVDGALTHSNVTIEGGATLTGTGGSMGGEVTLESGSALAFDLRGGSDYDALAIESLMVGANVDLVITLDYAPMGGENFLLLTDLTGYTGTFATLNGAAFDPSSFFLSYGGDSYEFRLNYGVSTIGLYAIPEPGTYALLGVAGLGLLFYRRRMTA